MTEYLFWFFGVIILGIYGTAFFLQNAQAKQDIAMFEHALSTAQQEQSSGELVVAETISNTDLNVSVSPDFKLWSKSAREKFSKLDASHPPMAVMSIDSLSLKVPIYEGASNENMDRGAAWVSYTADFTENNGNVGVAGHRDSWFRALKDIKIGDQIEVQTNQGSETYKVFQTKIVKPSNVDVLSFTPTKQLTLVTCYPFYFVGDAPERFIVMAKPIDIMENQHEQK